ncbi:hypothetical protein [Endozoicomonas sp. 2B-B]
MQYRLLPIVPLLVSFYSEAGQWSDLVHHSISYNYQPKTTDLYLSPIEVLKLPEAQWTDTFFYQPEASPLSKTKTFLPLNVATFGSSSIEISEADEGVFVTAFKVADRTSKTTSALEQVYLNHLDILRLNKIRLVFDSQFNTMRFSFHGKTFIISEFSNSEISEPYHSFLVPAILLMPEVLQLIVNLIQHLNEHPDGLEGKEAFPGGVLKQAEVNEYFIFPDMTLFPTYPNTSFCRGSSYCVPLSQYAWLVYSGHGKATIISDPYSSEEPMDADTGKEGEGGEVKKPAYAPLLGGFTDFRTGNIGSGGGIGAGSGGEDNDPPERATDYSRTPPEDRNESDYVYISLMNDISLLLDKVSEVYERQGWTFSDREKATVIYAPEGVRFNAFSFEAYSGAEIPKDMPQEELEKLRYALVLAQDAIGDKFKVIGIRHLIQKLKNLIGKSDDSREASTEAPVTSAQGSSETETTVTTPDTDAGATNDASGGYRHWMFLKSYGTLYGCGYIFEDVKMQPDDSHTSMSDGSGKASPEAPVPSAQGSSETETTVTTPDTDSGATSDAGGGYRHWMFLKSYGELYGRGYILEDVKMQPDDSHTSMSDGSGKALTEAPVPSAQGSSETETTVTDVDTASLLTNDQEQSDVDPDSSNIGTLQEDSPDKELDLVDQH